MEQAKLEYEKPFQYEQELTEKLQRQFELNTMLDLENKPIAEDKEESVIGIVEIPSLNIKYPIFEGTGNDALNTGIGHRGYRGRGLNLIYLCRSWSQPFCL